MAGSELGGALGVGVGNGVGVGQLVGNVTGPGIGDATGPGVGTGVGVGAGVGSGRMTGPGNGAGVGIGRGCSSGKPKIGGTGGMRGGGKSTVGGPGGAGVGSRITFGQKIPPTTPPRTRGNAAGTRGMRGNTRTGLSGVGAGGGAGWRGGGRRFGRGSVGGPGLGVGCRRRGRRSGRGGRGAGAGRPPSTARCNAARMFTNPGEGFRHARHAPSSARPNRPAGPVPIPTSATAIHRGLALPHLANSRHVALCGRAALHKPRLARGTARLTLCACTHSLFFRGRFAATLSRRAQSAETAGAGE